MSKKSLFVILILATLTTSVYAAPTTDKGQGINVWPRFWQWESPWNDDHYAGKPNKTMAKKGCHVTSLAMLLRYYGLTWRPNADHEPEPIPGCVINPFYCTITGQFIKTNPGTLNEWFTRNKLYNKNDDLIAGAVKYYYIRGGWWDWYNFVEPNYDCLERRQHGVTI